MALSSPIKTMFMPIALASITSLLVLSQGQLQVGFYSNSCPNAESIVSSVVREAALSDPTIFAALLRLHYHDCFVQGCDGSVLMDNPLDEGKAEKSAPNHAGLRGFNVIDTAKARLESECEGVVSCADIVALAARDSIALSQGPSYDVPTGRRDGLVSSVSDAENMPQVQDSVETLKQKFADKGLSEKDLVLLVSAHTIGTTACFFLEDRLYNFPSADGSDPSINPLFLPELKSRCPSGGDINVRLSLDRGSESTCDIQILRNIQSGFSALQSDAKLYGDESTKAIIDSYLGSTASTSGPFFESDFAESMVRLGTVGVITGSDGQIRRVCAQFN